MNWDAVMNFAGLVLEIGFLFILTVLFAENQPKDFDFLIQIETYLK
jgi:hypothetical protein